MSYDEYSGKPHGTMVVHLGDRTRVDVRIPAPPADGPEDRLVYLNVKIRWKITDRKNPAYYHQLANLRVNWQRVNDPDGDTAFQDYTVSAIKDEFLVTQLHWEHGKAHIGGYWEVEIDSPHASSAVLQTRYSKGRQVRLQ
jgi:hypothetical protein